MFPIRWNEIFRKKDGTLGTMEDLGGGGSALPIASANTLGGVKIGSGISIAEDGTISVSGGGGGTKTKIYYKDFNTPSLSSVVLAKFENDTASASPFVIYRPNGSSDSVSVNGYVPISAIAIDRSTGYSFNVAIKGYVDGTYHISMIIANRVLYADSLTIRVLYVQSSDYEAMPNP